MPRCLRRLVLDIKREIKSVEEDLKTKTERQQRLKKQGLLNSIANHGVVLFYNNNSPILCDSTCLSYLYIKNILEAKYIGSETYAEIKPISTIAINDISFSETYNILSNFPLTNEEKLLKKIKLQSNYILALIKNNQNLLYDFHSDINTEIETICRNLKK